MIQPIFHTTTQLYLDTFRDQLPQALLLHGKKGVGLLTAARYIASTRSTTLLQPTSIKKGSDDSTGGISVEVIRELYEQTRTRQHTPRVIIIDDADRMSIPAQNAFLKLLEEPNQSTIFILTSHQPEALLPTIRSRAPSIYIQPLTTEQSLQYISTLGSNDRAIQAQLLFLADGLPAELSRLITDADYFETWKQIITDARTLIAADTYQRLRIAWHYRQDRTKAINCIDAAIAILRHSLLTKPQPPLIIRLEKLLDARAKIIANQSIHLQLATVVL